MIYKLHTRYFSSPSCKVANYRNQIEIIISKFDLQINSKYVMKVCCEVFILSRNKPIYPRISPQIPFLLHYSVCNGLTLTHKMDKYNKMEPLH